MLTRLLQLLLLASFVRCVHAETGDSLTLPDGWPQAGDTLRLNRLQAWAERFGQTRLFRATYLGLPLVAGGLMEMRYDAKFRRLRNEFMPSFRHRIDDYMQFAPAAVMVGVKAAGLPGRSSWGRMLVSDAISAALATGVVQGLKHATHVMRPDGSDRHSFPSGHTATAFLTATLLSKEYGHVSPWFTIGGYTVATATG